MDKHTLRVLEFQKVLQMIADHATTEPGRLRVLGFEPLPTEHEILRRQRLISELRTLRAEGIPTGIEPFESMEGLFELLRPEDAVLDTLQLREFIPLLSSSLSLKRLSYEIKLEVLKGLLSSIHSHPSTLKEIERAIARDGGINDNASEELLYIRRSIRKLSDRIKKTLEDILNRRELKPHIQDFYITERNGRWVIPVKSDSKGHIKGVIHDISNTGETVFVEPREVQQLGDELESLRAEEKVEEFRILKRLSGMLRERLHEIESDYQIVVQVDSLQAVASFSDEISATMPEINRAGIIKIVKGRHPLLWKTLRKAHREDALVPLNFELGGKEKGMVITGSNTGGKTVTLKTVGVVVLMGLSGLSVPASSGTTIPMLKDVLADIGDEQSIEESLSTFSAHITRIREIIQRADRDTLIIIDELGTGTDPEEGGALACAILKRLIDRGALVIVSTHLGMLKAFAYEHPHLVNAAMQMRQIQRDGQIRYIPTYRLRVGEVGSSHALSIAENLGIPEEVINEARGLLSEGSDRIERMIASLREVQDRLNRELEEVQKRSSEIEELRYRLKKQQEELKTERAKVLDKAHEEAEELLRKIKTEAYRHLDELKKKERQRAKEHLRRLQEMHSMIKSTLHTEEGFTEPPEPGTFVRISGINLTGKVTGFNEKTRRCRVLVRGREIETSLDELRQVKEVKKENQQGTEVREKDENNVSIRQLNLIGYRVDPALSEVERFLNQAALSDLEEIRIIHGIGTGTLSRAIRDYLKEHPLVKEFRAGSKEEGGEGVTVVRLI